MFSVACSTQSLPCSLLVPLQKAAPSASVISVKEAVLNHPTCRDEVKTAACKAWEIKFKMKLFILKRGHFLLLFSWCEVTSFLVICKVNKQNMTANLQFKDVTGKLGNYIDETLLVHRLQLQFPH